MVPTENWIATLGNNGLLERLDSEVRTTGLNNYQQLINLVKDQKHPRIQGIGDDFLPDFRLYNALGAVYPLLDRKQRDEAVKAHLQQFDKLNYLAVNFNHTPTIREPLLLGDIVTSRPLY